MEAINRENELLEQIESLKEEIEDYKELIESIKNGGIDAIAIKKNGVPNILALESNDFVYRVLIENFAESALNVNESGLIIYANAAFETLLGTHNSSIIGAKIESLIDEDSVEYFKTLFQESFSGISKGELQLNYKGKKIPVYMSFSSLYPRFKGIGIIITDLTQKKEQDILLNDAKQELAFRKVEKAQAEIEHLRNAKTLLEEHSHSIEEKNQALINANVELTSFTYIASHDLKEPLRKIRLFINRIHERNQELFTPETKEDFSRISSAADRMQALIDALLNYSQVNNTQFKMESIDLNSIVDEVRNNLQEIIADKLAVINVGDLPTLNIIPIQFTQLFTNLISNAIKYSRSDVSPVISIDAKIISSRDIFTEVSLPEGSYWQISFKDNGIGFEQKYEHKIFELFQRLHDKEDYPGTGIGLAICNKVVQNHKGIMTASGDTNTGATFNIYLPILKPANA
ncbi:MAG: sensor signal transduction histidine kinase, phytochrome A-like protein [Bacteroidetes bacterium]|nr:sensor signal transduction histidine kinase, phytochrome A-like protein [Bacteroidota bacterium]